MTDTASAWLLTYLLHSTAFIAAAWLVGRFGRASFGAKNMAWKVALLGPFLSASWHVGSSGHAAPSLRPHAFALSAQEAPAALRAIPVVSTPPARPAQPFPWALAAALALPAVALIRLTLLAERVGRLRRRLAGRRPVGDVRAIATLERLRAESDLRRPVRLTRSADTPTPMALGRAEICLPERALAELEAGPLRAVLAHELAHLEREDNLWLGLAAVLEAVCFFQPLARLVGRGLRETAEYVCDDRAVALTGNPLGLARSLATVAAWQVPFDFRPLAHPAADPAGPLVRRVERLVEGAPPDGRGRRLLVLAVFLALGLATPVVIVGHGAEAGTFVPAPLPRRAAPPEVVPVPPLPPVPPVPPASAPHARRLRVPPVPPFPPMPPMPALPNIPPVPPLPPLPPFPPIEGIVKDAVGKAMPRAFEAAGKLVPLALELARAEEALRASEHLPRAELEQQRRKLEETRRALREQEAALDRDMEKWSQGFNKQFNEKFNRELSDSMEAWGREFGAQMEQWSRQFETELNRGEAAPKAR